MLNNELLMVLIGRSKALGKLELAREAVRGEAGKEIDRQRTRIDMELDALCEKIVSLYREDALDEN